MRDLAANSPPDFHLGSSLSGRASKARYYRSARGFKDLIKCDNKVYINSDAATLTTGCRQQCGAGSDMLGGSGEGKLTRRRQARLNKGLPLGKERELSIAGSIYADRHSHQSKDKPVYYYLSMVQNFMATF